MKDKLLLGAKGLLVLAFVASGLTKLSANPEMVANIAKMGLPTWFLFFIGAAELLGGLALIAKRLTIPASLGLLVIMIGAVAVHFAAQDQLGSIPAAALGLLLTFVLHESLPQIATKSASSLQS